MDSSRAQNTTMTEPSDPGEEPDGGDGNVGRNATRHQGQSLNNSNDNNNFPSPPSYPCSSTCIRCGKNSSPDNDSEVQPNSTENLMDCLCECHIHGQLFPQKPNTPIMHIPPVGPNCLPGCGYSGLPCYNCSSFQNNIQSQDPVTQPSNQRFPTHIYTVEMLNPAIVNGLQSQRTPASDHTIIMQSEDGPPERKKRRTCISLVLLLIIINVAIGVFRMMVGTL